MGQCLGKFQKGGTQKIVKDPFPDHFTDSQICDYYVDRLPARLVGEGIHLLRGRPGPIVQGWTHELLNDAGVHGYQDRELLLKTRDEIVSAVEVHRQRLRQLQPSRPVNYTDCRSRTASFSTTEPSMAFTGPPGLASTPVAPPNTPKSSFSGDPTSFVNEGAEDVGPGAVPASSIDRVAARQQQAAAAAAAAAVAAEATAKSTAFCSEGDGKSFRLTTDWLPSGPRLYRISEEIRHMASSGNLDLSVHSKSAGVLDGPAAAKAATAATAGSSALLQTRSKSRFCSSTAGGGGDTEADGERDGEGGMNDRDADGKVVSAAAALTSVAVSCAGVDGCGLAGSQRGYDASLGISGLSPGAADQAVAPPPPPLNPQRQHRGNGGGGNSCCSGGSGSGDDSGSAGSQSLESTLGADSLAALTALEAPQPPSPAEQLLQAEDIVSSCCTVSGREEPHVTQVALRHGACGKGWESEGKHDTPVNTCGQGARYVLEGKQQPQQQQGCR